MSLWNCFGISQHRRISLNNSYLCVEYRLISFALPNNIYIVLRQICDNSYFTALCNTYLEDSMASIKSK